MFNGIDTFQLSRVVRIMPVLLHISIALFFSGLVIFVSNLNFLIGVVVLVFVSVFALAYVVLTVLPHVYFNCPYSTPISELSWRPLHHLTLFLLRLSRPFLPLLPNSKGQSWRVRWRHAVDAAVKRVKHGLRGSITDNAEKPRPKEDEDALSWTLSVLDDDREFENFVARVPGFFESDSFQKAPSVMFSLMDVQSSQFHPILGSCINDLLKTCVPGTSPLKEESRRNRLRICLRALWYFAREYIQLGIATPLPDYVRTRFADSEMARRIQSEEDVAARLIGRSFSSLVVKKLAPGSLSSDGKVPFLAAILDITSNEVTTLFDEKGAIGLANIISLASSEMDTLTKQTAPSEVLGLFQETLDLLKEDLHVSAAAAAKLPQALVTKFREAYSNAQLRQAPDWLMGLLRRMERILEGPSADESVSDRSTSPSNESTLEND